MTEVDKSYSTHVVLPRTTNDLPPTGLKWNQIMQPTEQQQRMKPLGLTRHEARKVVFVSRRLQETVADALDVLTADERQHAESTWAGAILELTTRRSTVLPMEEAWTILDQGGI